MLLKHLKNTIALKKNTGIKSYLRPNSVFSFDYVTKEGDEGGKKRLLNDF